MPENSAARVHALMVQAKSRRGQAFKVWAEVFGLDPEKTQIPEITTRLVAMYQELLLAEEETKASMKPERATAKLQHFPILKRSLLSFDLNSGFDQIKDVMSDAALVSLELLSHDLEEDPKKEQSQIDKISDEVNELFKQVTASNLHKKLKEFVLTWLSKIRSALDRFRISGVRGRQDALTQIQGEGYILKPVVDEIEKQDPTLWQRVQNFFLALPRLLSSQIVL